MELVFDKAGKDLLCFLFAMHQHDLHTGMRHFPDPIQNLALPGVRGKPANRKNFGLDGDIFIEKPDGACAIDDLTARRADALIPDKDDAGRGTPCVVPEVVLDAPGIAHSACGNDDRRPFHHIQRLGLQSAQGKFQVGQQCGHVP